MLNIDTFKNLCMIAKTDKGKEIRNYYVKLENIYNKIIKEEIENKDELLENNCELQRHNILL
jgi:phage anti-repressor protein